MSASRWIRARWASSAAVAGALAVLAACETTPSGKLDLDAVLTERGACGDGVFYAISDGDAAVLVVSVPGLFASAVEGGVADVGWTVPDEDVAIEAYFGTRVGASICDGPPSGALVDHAYVGTAGEAFATASSDGSAMAELTGVELTHVEGRGDPLTVSMRIEGTFEAD